MPPPSAGRGRGPGGPGGPGGFGRRDGGPGGGRRDGPRRGDGNGRVGVGQGKAREVPAAIAKASESARKSMFDVPLVLATIPHQVLGEASGAVVMLKPASPGTGVIAGGPVRAVVEAAGIKDILSKSLGSSNPINIVNAAIAGLRSLRRPEDIARGRGRDVHEIAPRPMLEGMAEAEL